MDASPITPLRAAQKEDTRARILSAARQLFGEQGVAATSVQQISLAAETSRANFYLHFKGRDELLHALRREMWQMALGFYEDFASLPDIEHATLRRWLERVAAAWRQDGGITRIVLGAAPQAVEREYQLQLARYVDAAVANRARWRDFTPAESRRRAYLLIVQLERCMNDQDHIDLPVERDALLDTLASLWAAALLPPTR